jgi:hypothetical protein
MGKPFIASSKAAADRIRRDAFSATMKGVHLCRIAHHKAIATMSARRVYEAGQFYQAVR